MEFWNVISHLEGIITPVAVSVATWLWVRLRDAQKKDKAEHQAMMVMLHAQLFADGTNYMHRGYITTDELDDFNLLYLSYHSLGGNGTGEEVHRRVLALPIEASEFGIVEAVKKKHEHQQE